MLFGDGLYGAVRQMAPAFVSETLGAGVGGLSVLLSGAGVGATVAALWLAHGGAARAAPATILWGFLGFSAAVTALALSNRVSEGVVAMAALGACFEVCRTGSVALLQLSVPDAMRSRIMSGSFLLTRLASAIGVAAIGWAAADWGLKGPLLCGAALALLAWGGAVGGRSTRSTRRKNPPPGIEDNQDDALQPAVKLPVKGANQNSHLGRKGFIAA
jgi:hypothetical protein